MSKVNFDLAHIKLEAEKYRDDKGASAEVRDMAGLIAELSDRIRDANIRITELEQKP